MDERREESGRDWSAFAVCTIVAKNYISLARVVCSTFLERHPGARAFVLLADESGGVFDPRGEAFETIEAREIGVPEFEDFTFKYDVLELSTALKPFFLQFLFERRGVEKLIYLDPDIQVFGTFRELADELESHDVVLTPHILRPLHDDGRRPNETDFLVSGAYNLGFVAMRRSEAAGRLLEWWQARLYDHCFSDPARGLFTDQKWMNLAPCISPGVSVLRHPGYNVAYWNFQERELSDAPGGGYLVEGAPLRFVHFSGFDRSRPNDVSKYQDRFRLPDLGRRYREIFEGYSRLLERSGFEESRRWPYAFGTFDNGATIPRFVRRAFWEFGAERRRFGDPFAASGEGSYFSWLVAPHRLGSPIPNVAMPMYAQRVDLQRAFPDVHGASAPAFLDWLLAHSERDFGVRGAYHDAFRRAREELGAPKAPQAPAGPAETPTPVTVEGAHPFGVNLFGYFDTESGVGEISRSLAAMLREAEIPHALVNVEQQWLRRNDRTIASFSSEWPYAVNVLCVNADQAPHVCARFGLARDPGRYQIGYWFWELSRFPSAMTGAMSLFDELWVASAFCQDALARAGRTPVVKILPGFEPRPPRRKGRRDFGLSEDEFVFLYVFDAASILKRKNPGGTIAAFREAFAPEENVRLLLKTTNATERQLRALSRLAGPARVSVWNDYLDRADLLDLVASVDAYVSLHRSEGLGLTPLEALLFGKPVIATDYSGVREFLDAPGARPVRFREVPLRRDHGPYRKGSVWAEPDAAHATARMRETYEAFRGRSSGPLDASEVRRRFSVASTAATMAERLQIIRRFLSNRHAAA